jgi:hypothetical protein
MKPGLARMRPSSRLTAPGVGRRRLAAWLDGRGPDVKFLNGNSVPFPISSPQRQEEGAHRNRECPRNYRLEHLTVT